MIEYSAIKRDLMNEVGRRISTYGFKPVLSRQEFIRPSSTGREALHLAFVRHSTDFDVVADVAVRFDELERLRNRIRQDLSDREKNATYSLGAELGNIARTGQRRWNVASQEDINPAAEQLVNSFAEIGLPYLERVSTLEKVYALLAVPSEDAWIYSVTRNKQAMNAVGLATLLDKKAEAVERAQHYYKWLKDKNDFGLDQFTQFVADLGITL